MANVVWLPEAKQDIQRLHDFLKEQNPQAAQACIQAIRAEAQQLGAYPESGRPMSDDTGRRQLFISFGAAGYVLRYMLDGDLVVVIRVWHTREDR